MHGHALRAHDRATQIRYAYSPPGDYGNRQALLEPLHIALQTTRYGSLAGALTPEARAT
jgi:hypothetical protein